MFKLDQESARAWLTRVIAAYEAGDSEASGTAEMPPLGAAWNPLDPGEESTIYLLVRRAQEAGVLTAPPGAEVDFEYSDDCDGGYYRFLLDLSAPAPLKLASYAEEMRKLGEREATGIDAAMAILREAQHAANQLLYQLAEFIAATAAQPSISCPQGRGMPALPAGFNSEASRS
jgi:hypothetical protein